MPSGAPRTIPRTRGWSVSSRDPENLLSAPATLLCAGHLTDLGSEEAPPEPRERRRVTRGLEAMRRPRQRLRTEAHTVRQLAIDVFCSLLGAGDKRHGVADHV